MVEIVEWNGWLYRRYPESEHLSDQRYFQRSTKRGRRTLHRDIWESAFGSIPKGCHIHHKDGDTTNNVLETLECVSAKQHMARHPWDDARKARQAQHLDRVRPLTKKWHRSAGGRAKHKKIAALAYAAFIPVPKACEHCGSIFNPRKIGNVDRFCSNACRSAHRRKSGIDDIKKICARCGRGFYCNKYAATVTCSRSCANRHRSRSRSASV
jgi:hypothetical protein